MKFEKGDLVVHARGTVYPFDKLQGVVVKTTVFAGCGVPVYRVFWYTLSSYQNIQENCLKPLDNSLT